MDNLKKIVVLRPPQWKWVGVGFCFYVSFHLLPSYITGVSSIINNENPWMTPIWLTWIFFGIGVIGAFIGYHSRGVTILEPAIASLLYILVLAFAVPKFWSPDLGLNKVSILIFAFISAFIVATAGATFGEVLQARKERKRSAQRNI